MKTIYIHQKGTELSVSDGVLAIATAGAADKRRLPLAQIERIVLHTHTRLCSRVLCTLAAAGIPLVAFGGRRQQHLASLGGTPHNDARRRWRQTLQLNQPHICTQLACTILRTKLRRQCATLRALTAARHLLRRPVNDACKQLHAILAQLQSPTAATALTLDQLRGLEGAAAAAYFRVYFQAFAPALQASGRNRRPPRDPVNATLSLAYTLLYGLATNTCHTLGLDPALGALHSLAPGRAALACDLIEPHRPRVDLWVWHCFRNRQLRPEHFQHQPNGACLLGKSGRKHFYAAWQQTPAPRFQRLLLAHGRTLIRALEHTAQPHQQESALDTPPAEPTP